jgi:hypothetical protein
MAAKGLNHAINVVCRSEPKTSGPMFLSLVDGDSDLALAPQEMYIWRQDDRDGQGEAKDPTALTNPNQHQLSHTIAPRASKVMSEIEKAAHTPDTIKTESQVEHLDPKMIDTGAVGQNPLARLTDEQIIVLAEDFVEQHGLGEYKESILKGALVAKDPLSEPVFPEVVQYCMTLGT